MKKPRKHYAPEEKVAILRRHLLEKEPISKLCDELGLQPTVFYRWQKEFFENGAFCLRAESTAEPLRRAGANRLPGEEDPDQGRGSGRADGRACGPKKNAWGTLTGVWVPHDTRDQIVDFVRRWSGKTEIGAGRFMRWLDITASKFYGWRERYGKVNEHNRWFPGTFGWRIGRSRRSLRST